MIVTFVSECEKKALARSRRVLDAFANRIGERTWQTVITEDGLIAVKKLLRKTATKNTAVACHWIRSRARTELMWVVGNILKFDFSGIVPVNTTQKELIKDINTMDQHVLYANTQQQHLEQHLFSVGWLAKNLLLSLFPDHQELAKAAFVAGCLHDLGKIDEHFQSWVCNPKKKDFLAEDGQHIDDKKFSFDTHPRHNELSLLLFYCLDQYENKTINIINKKSIKHTIYWHHAKPLRKDEYSNLDNVFTRFKGNVNNQNWDCFQNQALKCLRSVIELDKQYDDKNESFLEAVFPSDLVIDTDKSEVLSDQLLPEYKEYDCSGDLDKYKKSIQINSINNVLRAVVISADRSISELTAQDLTQKIEQKNIGQLMDVLSDQPSSLISDIDRCLSDFEARYPNSQRNNKQSAVAQQLQNSQDIAVLAGPAGCGKTKIALEWAKLKQAKKIFWICPRVQVCLGIFNELVSDVYLPNTHIEIHTGEYKWIQKEGKCRETSENDYFSGDVVITTIDQIIGNITTHTKVTGFLDYLKSHVVFDEYHEYIHMPAFNLFFAELVQSKKNRGADANTLLVSATPHYYFLENVLDIREHSIVAMDSFNPCSYQIEFVEYDENQEDTQSPLYQPQTNNTFIISNTALTAQKTFIANQHQENAILLHSKYKKSDKKKWFDAVFESFKQDGSHRFNVLRSGPIVQASLNISCDHMISDLTTAENCLQRLGRLDRFGKNKNQVNVLKIVIPQSINQGKGNGKMACFLARMDHFVSSCAWYDFLQNQLSQTSFLLPDIYRWYREFYQLENNQQKVKQDLLSSLKKGADLIKAKVMDPIVFPTKKTTEKTKNKISKNSLRGDNRFVQMAVCDMTKPDSPQFKNDYAYELNDGTEPDNLTASVSDIEGWGDSVKNLLAHMAKKHHNIVEGAKKPYKDWILLNEARSPEHPIYLSYTPKDLEKVGGKSERHPHAIYYIMTDKQPVGAMTINDLLTTEEK